MLVQDKKLLDEEAIIQPQVGIGSFSFVMATLSHSYSIGSYYLLLEGAHEYK